MKNEWLIAQRLYYDNRSNHSRTMSRPAVKVALAAIIIGIAVMILTVFIVVGFKSTITEKVVGFGSHIQVLNFDNNNTYQLRPIYINDTLLTRLKSIDGVSSAEPFATKPGILKTDSQFQAIVFKGMPLNSSNMLFFERNLKQGTMPAATNQVLISEHVAKLLNLKHNTSVLCYFIEDHVLVRKFHIVGTYSTDFSDFDDLFVVGDISAVQQLNQWESNQVSGVEILINDFSMIEDISNRVYFATANQADEAGNFLMTQNVVQQNPAIFSWLDLLDMNVIVIILLMLCVSGFNIISGLLILILDSVQFIGIMKALGATNNYLRHIYLIQAFMLIVRGIVWGNVIALLLSLLQYYFHLIPLDATAYYVSYVPISFHWGWWAVVNIGTIAVSMLILLAPSAILTRISPAKVMQFE